jgi:hypothetical protein
MVSAAGSSSEKLTRSMNLILEEAGKRLAGAEEPLIEVVPAF